MSCIFECLFSMWSVGVITIAYLVYRLTTYNDNYFAKKGMKYVKPWPLFGNSGGQAFGLQSYHQSILKNYKMFPNERFFGTFEYMTPVYYITDPKLIRQITVEDFDHFVNHRGDIDETIEPLLSRMLFFMKDRKWRHMRTTLDPAFTSSKMKQIFELVQECAQSTVAFISAEGKIKSVEIEAKDLFNRFANDVIATSAFGIEINSQKQDNDFFLMVKKASSSEGIQSLKFDGFMCFPALMKFFRIKMYDKKTVDFFRGIVSSTIKYREANGIIRPDMLNLLIQANKEGALFEETDSKLENVGFATVEESNIKKPNTIISKWEDDDLTAQVLLFFIGGFDTVSTCMSFTAHELAVNPMVQERLIQEIDEIHVELKGKPLTYEALQKMKYLDMVVNESLRKWPPGVATDRYCSIPYVMENSDGTKVQLNVNDAVCIPIIAIQNDPKYFPNPKMFDPERFSEENKGNIQPFTYLPFGIGPRKCIGYRFILMEVKIIIFNLLSVFTIDRSPKTQEPLVFKKNDDDLTPVNGFYLQLNARNAKVQ